MRWCPSFKYNYLFQIQITLVNISTRAYNFTIKRILSALNAFTRKNKRCYIYLPILNTRPSSSSHRRCSIRNGVLRNFVKFTGKLLCQGLFSNKVAGLRPATLLKKWLWHRCFPVNFAKFLKTPFLQNTSGRLLPGVIFRRSSKSNNNESLLLLSFDGL